ncbi:MAG: CPBP family glutamic-type intramembrane protease [Defluviitaleaceae bacterium]|nr:CPBP family glutamic-type intramembrane protease [Defluviitaleaceae bacterium]
MFFGYIIFITAVVAIRGALSVSWQLDALITIATTAFPAAIVFLIVLRNKQGLSSIGLHKEKIWSAARLGLLFCLIPILFIAVIPGVSGGFNELLVGALLVNLVTTFFFAAHEDVIFVGFIQTRLYGFLKTDKAAIPAGAFLFALMHVPPWLMMGRFDADNLLVGIIQAFLAWFLMHLIFVSVFKKYHSLIPVFILHTVHNFSWNFAQTSFVRGIDFSFIMLLLYALAAGILFWRTRK